MSLDHVIGIKVVETRCLCGNRLVLLLDTALERFLRHPAVPRRSQKRSKKDRLVKLSEKEEDSQKLETVDVGESLDKCTFQSDNLALLTNVLRDGENGHDEQAANALMDSPNSHCEKQEFSSHISVQSKQELDSSLSTFVFPFYICMSNCHPNQVSRVVRTITS